MSESLAKAMIKKNSKARKTFMMGSDEGLLSEIPYWVSIGCWPLDAIIGGGIPAGRLIELYGDESTGKSLLALYAIHRTQQVGGIGLLLDPEATTTMDMARRVGINIDDLIVGYPDTIEDVYDQIKIFLDAKRDIDKTLQSVTPAIIVWDSIASTVAAAEMEAVDSKGLGKATMATHARAMSKMLRILPRELSYSGVIGLFTNQTREKIGVLYGDKVATPGGKALKFYASVRIALKTIRKYKSPDAGKGGDAIGIEVRATITKNKVDKPYGSCTFPILFDSGIDNAIACFSYLKELDIITTSGPFHVMTLQGKEHKFYKNKWHEIFEDNVQYIKQYVLESAVPRVDEIDDDEEE